ncbi:MAG: CDP-glycerol glycerophosphotransferase family protein [Deltaproteobacteria bacterium]|nr:CDP-glycerol glycerophosphotransferase family protein [Deltaproteobacteria bacterium]
MTDGSRPDDVLGELDRAVDQFETIFGGIEIEGDDLAGTNRLSVYVALQTEQAFASPRLAERAWQTLVGHAVYLRYRLGGSRPEPPPPVPEDPRLLFLFEGANPSTRETLRHVLEQFDSAEARAATPYPETLSGKTGHSWIDIRDFLPRTEGASLRGAGKAIWRAQRRARRQGAHRVFQRHSFRAWLMRAAIRTAAASLGLHRLFDAHPATMLVTASDTSFWGRCATLEANRRGIPSLTLQHGMMVGDMGYTPVVSTKFAAWGDASARWLQARGVPAEKIEVTGAPRLDAIVNRKPIPRETIATQLRINPAARWIVLATNPITFARNAAMVGVARDGLRSWGEQAVLIVKLHPSEDAAPYRALIAWSDNAAVVRHGEVDLYDLLAAADAVLTFHSSVGLEAMMLERPVVSLEAFGEENPLPYAREGAAVSARSAAELVAALRRELDPGEIGTERRELRARFISDNLFAADGKSGERVRELIKTLAAGGAR